MPNPFLLSPGLDPDAWRILLAARYIAEHHTYLASRLPGYPVPELVYSVFVNCPTWISIGLTFLVSVGGFLSYHKILGTIGVKNRLLLTLAFAFTPVVLINCFTTMDYMWAISFAMFSLLLGMRGHTFISGIFLGIAVGCRMSTVLFAAPLCLLLWWSHEGPSMKAKECFRFLSSLTVVSLLCYGPVVAAYGMSFLPHSSRSGIRIATLGKLLTVDTFGIIGVLTFALALTIQAIKGGQRLDPEIPAFREWKTLSWLVVGLFGILFLLLPLDAGYLIPIIPFLLLLARLYLSPETFRIVAIGLILSPFFISMDSTDRPWSAPASAVSIKASVAGRMVAVDILSGPLIHDLLKRKSELSYSHSVLEWAQSYPDSAALVAGVWMPPLTYLAGKSMSESEEENFGLGKVAVVGLLEHSSAASYQRKSVHIFYLPGQDRYNEEVYGIRLRQFGATELNVKEVHP